MASTRTRERERVEKKGAMFSRCGMLKAARARAHTLPDAAAAKFWGRG